MPPFRNFLARKPQANGTGPDGFDEADLSPSSQSSPVAIRRSEDQQPPEYKMSVVNDSGVYLPPSPPEKQSFWSRQTGSKRTTNHRDLVDNNEPFSISRESFDSYRRSFDISARSPVTHSDAAPSRTSLDSRFSRITSPATQSTSFEKPEPMEEEVFEDVGLTDENKPKKKGFLSRFGDSSDASSPNSKTSTPFGFHIPGTRKRGQSGVGSELNPIQPSTPVPQASTGNE
ncbi:hypothetical protein N7468_001818 [Penicillium chermesinum]|uniref:Uncharacterized protein n=1 Tax=Penicillium chermesinum TaxID=63820 RepID=A0A9W9TX29_9EURO|nr:uncharacterized protein N7468_001818 [Penicillium chermesinum]KAJ5246835.1 hypothetical protein N7468_001818 [Penicillium chermesinum]KAJ6145094.1 hypothetical protein N7470_008989 [Penicillium chermesinum]